MLIASRTLATVGRAGVSDLPRETAAAAPHEPVWCNDFLPVLDVVALFGGASFEVLLPCYYVSKYTEHLHTLDALWTHPTMQGLAVGGGSFWMRRGPDCPMP